jgi:adenylate kinase family enzyme
VNQILILTGPPGAGKTAVAEAICERFDRMVHIPVDDLRHWVKAGYRHPWAGDAQAHEQLRMAIWNASTIARVAIEFRYAVVIDDVVLRWQAEEYREALRGIGASVHLVTLLPSLASTLERDAARGPDAMADRVRAVHEAFRDETDRGQALGAVLDTSGDEDAYVTADRVQDTVSRGEATLLEP